MKSRYILVGMLLTALAAGMLSGCGKKQEEESQTVSIVYEADSKEENSEISKESAGALEDTEDNDADSSDTTAASENEQSAEEVVLPSDLEGIDVQIDITEETAANVGMGVNAVIVDNKDTEEIELMLDDEDIIQLENMNFYVPLFDADAAHDDAFQKEVLKYGFADGVNGGESVTLEDASGNQAEGYKVAENAAASYYKNLLGEELTIKPEKPQSFGDETPVYYEDGYYYIGVMPGTGVGYMYHRTYQKDSTVYVAFYMFDDTDTYSDYVFALEWADNDNGFIVKAHYYDEQAK